MAERWATFDCYGTLIDWNAGIRATLVGIWPEADADALLARYHEMLRINGRNFQDFATLSPGVIRDPRGGDLSVGGQRGTFNSLQVDGVDNNNTFFGQALGRGGVRPPYQFSEVKSHSCATEATSVPS